MARKIPSSFPKKRTNRPVCRSGDTFPCGYSCKNQYYKTKSGETRETQCKNLLKGQAKNFMLWQKTQAERLESINKKRGKVGLSAVKTTDAMMIDPKAQSRARAQSPQQVTAKPSEVSKGAFTPVTLGDLTEGDTVFFKVRKNSKQPTGGKLLSVDLAKGKAKIKYKQASTGKTVSAIRPVSELLMAQGSGGVKAEVSVKSVDDVQPQQPKTERPQVAQPTKYKSGITIKTEFGQQKGDLYLLPGHEDLNLIVVKPGGNKTKGTKHGYEVYEQESGLKVDSDRNPNRDEPLSNIFQRVSATIKKKGGNAPFMEKVRELVKDPDYADRFERMNKPKAVDGDRPQTKNTEALSRKPWEMTSEEYARENYQGLLDRAIKSEEKDIADGFGGNAFKAKAEKRLTELKSLQGKPYDDVAAKYRDIYPSGDIGYQLEMEQIGAIQKAGKDGAGNIPSEIKKLIGGNSLSVGAFDKAVMGLRQGGAKSAQPKAVDGEKETPKTFENKVEAFDDYYQSIKKELKGKRGEFDRKPATYYGNYSISARGDGKWKVNHGAFAIASDLKSKESAQVLAHALNKSLGEKDFDRQAKESGISNNDYYQQWNKHVEGLVQAVRSYDVDALRNAKFNPNPDKLGRQPSPTKYQPSKATIETTGYKKFNSKGDRQFAIYFDDAPANIGKAFLTVEKIAKDYPEAIPMVKKAIADEKARQAKLGKPDWELTNKDGKPTDLSALGGSGESTSKSEAPQPKTLPSTAKGMEAFEWIDQNGTPDSPMQQLAANLVMGKGKLDNKTRIYIDGLQGEEAIAFLSKVKKVIDSDEKTSYGQGQAVRDAAKSVVGGDAPVKSGDADRQSKPPHESTLSDFIQQEKDALIAKYPQSANKKMVLDDNAAKAKDKWVKALKEQAQKGRLSDDVIDSYESEYGRNALLSTFRGVAEKGIDGWIPPESRNGDRQLSPPKVEAKGSNDRPFTPTLERDGKKAPKGYRYAELEDMQGIEVGQTLSYINKRKAESYPIEKIDINPDGTVGSIHLKTSSYSTRVMVPSEFKDSVIKPVNDPYPAKKNDHLFEGFNHSSADKTPAPTAPTETKSKVRGRNSSQELNAMLKGFVAGTPSSKRYQVLSDAKKYANEKGLDLPDWVQPELTKAAKEVSGVSGTSKSTTSKFEMYPLKGEKIVEKSVSVKGSTTPKPFEPNYLGRIPTESISFDPSRFQYKVVHGPTGASGSLSGIKKWNESASGVLMVWKDPGDGKTYVINGHNRATLAKNLSVPTLPVKFIDAKNANEARAAGAIANIAEGRGNPIDAAKFFRDSQMSRQDLEEIGIPMKESIATKGMALASLPEHLFMQVYMGSMPVDRAVQIGCCGLSHAQQDSLAKMIESQDRKGRNVTNAMVSELVDTVKASGTTQTQTLDLFGNSVDEKSLAIEVAGLQAFVKRKLGRDKKLFGSVSRSSAAKDLERAGNEINVDDSAKIAKEADIGLTTFDQFKNLASPVSKLLNEGARRIVDGESKKKVEDDIYEKIAKVLPTLLPDGQGKSSKNGDGVLGGSGNSQSDNQISLFSERQHLIAKANGTLSFSQPRRSMLVDPRIAKIKRRMAEHKQRMGVKR